MTAQTATLTDFLAARVAEDEDVARKASRGPWRVDSEVHAEYISDADGLAVVSGGRWGGEASVFTDTDDAIHIARHDPARVLAECEAKRRIVERCEATLRGDSEYGHEHADATDTLIDLALPYASHPDFRPEWRA